MAASLAPRRQKAWITLGRPRWRSEEPGGPAMRVPRGGWAGAALRCDIRGRRCLWQKTAWTARGRVRLRRLCRTSPQRQPASSPPTPPPQVGDPAAGSCPQPEGPEGCASELVSQRPAPDPSACPLCPEEALGSPLLLLSELGPQQTHDTLRALCLWAVSDPWGLSWWSQCSVWGFHV